MKTSAILALFLSATILSPADAKLLVVTTLTDYAALAREIGGDQVEVTAMAKPTEDPHFVDARPSFVVKLRNADLLIEGGAELEAGWLPPLLQNARNPKIETGSPGRVIASAGLKMLGVPTTLSRAAGDVHAMGNPHFMVDPIVAKDVARRIALALSTADPANGPFYQDNYKKFELLINAKLQEWGMALLPFKGASIVAYHDSWIYFAHRFGFTIDLFLEAKPGIPPSPSHLAEVIGKIKEGHIKAILVEPYQNRKIAEKVSTSTGAHVVDFAQFPGAFAGAESYEAHIDELVKRLAVALK